MNPMRFKNPKDFQRYYTEQDLERIESFTLEDFESLVEVGECGGETYHRDLWNSLESLLPHAVAGGKTRAVENILDGIWVPGWTGEGESRRRLTLQERLAVYQLVGGG